MRDPVIERVREIDERLADVPLPPGLERRVLATVGERPSGHARILVGAAVLAALVLAFALGLRMRGDAASAPASEPTIAIVPHPITVSTNDVPTIVRAWDGALALDPTCEGDVDGDVVRVDAGCRMTLDAPALAVEAWGPARIVRARDGLRLLDGRIELAVEHVRAGEPRVRVEVDAGAIEVLGTRFSVVQDGTDGHVDLLDGAIVFVDREGTEHAVRPGQRLTWASGHVVVPAPTRGPKPSTARASSLDLDATLDEVAALRRAGRYREAIGVLRDARREHGDGRGAEILSFEEGTLREHDDDAAAMCAFWRGHLGRFPDGDYAAAVRGRIESAGCEAR